ncbi:M56 family metallopeptidase [Flavobacterium sp. N2038]|uniref:M56 family metallopeptidase n=1 Tax=Flavobacterium sp. N2038 TaxID=2986829 RepID=UPI002225A4FC|nr:M56 family metallopeptidase [Flavobacterium sp. N2038]
MEALLIYIAKSTGLVILFYCAYYFLLRKETFFNSNRWFLLIGLFTSVILPFAVYTKIIWVKPTPTTAINLSSINTFQTIESNSTEINWLFLVSLVYCIGFLILLVKLGMDFYSLHTVLKGKKIQQQADFKFIDTTDNIAPFSYFEYIVYNSSMYTPSELENIIEHEKVHSDQNHTIDVLISRAFCLLFWFNPVIWLYKKAITQNLEFIADKEAAQKISDKKAYQYTLLKITTHESCVAITNHFYQSLIKKRIVMLNKNQSKKGSSWKLCLVIPALAAFVFLFQIEVIAKEKKEIKKEVLNNNEASEDIYKISKTTTDQELKEIAENLKKKHNTDAVFSDVRRNSNNELTGLKVDLKRSSEEAQVFMIEGNQAIKECQIIVVTESDGSKNIKLVTENEATQVKVTEQENKVEVKKVKNSKTDCNAKTNNNTHTSISTSTCTHTADVNVNVNANVNSDVNANPNTNVKIIKTSYNSNFNIEPRTNTITTIQTNGSESSKKITQLVVVNGEVNTDIKKGSDIQNLRIETIRILKDENAIKKYGDKGKDGVIEIETN